MKGVYFMRKNKLCLKLFLVVFCLFGLRMNVYADLASEAATKSCEELRSSGVLDASSGSILFDGSGYKANCVYSKTETMGFLMFKKKSCVLFQIAFNSDDGSYATKKLVPFSNSSISDLSKNEVTVVEKFLDQTFLDQDVILKMNNICPIKVYFRSGGTGGNDFVIGKWQNMTRIYKTDVPVEIPSLITNADAKEYKTCEEILGSSGVKILKTIKSIIFVVCPIILIVLGTLDFAQAVFAQSEDGIKKAQQKFVKRLIITVVIFLVPSVLQVILNLAHSIWPVIDNSLCGIL